MMMTLNVQVEQLPDGLLYSEDHGQGISHASVASEANIHHWLTLYADPDQPMQRHWDALVAWSTASLDQWQREVLG